MRGLAGPASRAAASHAAVIVSLPVDGSGEAVVRANAWMIGRPGGRVHGLLLIMPRRPAPSRRLSRRRAPYTAVSVRGGSDGVSGGGHAAAMWGGGGYDPGDAAAESRR